jgi:hypothetical protein
MRDFSLLYGPARTWAAVLGTAIVAVAIGFFVQGSANAQQSDQEIQAEAAANRSSSPSPADADAAASTDGDETDQTSSADRWSAAPQSAEDIPFVSLQPSPEPITEAGQDLVSANATTTVPSPVNPNESESPASSPESGDDDDGGDDAPAGTQDQGDQPDDDGQPGDEVVNTSTTPLDDDAEPVLCQGRGDSKADAIDDFRSNCEGKRKDCDPVADGSWVCANQVLVDTVVNG